MFNDIYAFLASRWPTTPAEWTLHIGGGVLFNLVILSIMEHRIHLNLMHIRAMPKWVYKAVPFFARFQRRHHVLHHHTYYQQFDYEPNPEGRYENIFIRFYQSLIIGAAVLPVFLLVCFVSPVVAITFGLLGFLHNRLWGVVHVQMHIPKDVFFRRWAIYRFLARHHFIHHQQPFKNLNVVVPMADWFFGTVAKPTLGDVREMLRLGYLLPRSERAKRLQPLMKPRPGYTFATNDDAEQKAPPVIPPAPKAPAGSADAAA